MLGSPGRKKLQSGCVARAEVRDETDRGETSEKNEVWQSRRQKQGSPS